MAKDKVQFENEPGKTERTRIVGMKWRNLGEDKDPEWNKEVLLFEPPATYCLGTLSGIHLTSNGRVFTFTHEDIPWGNKFSHYAIPTIPV